MKKIALIGCTSWKSYLYYYHIINEAIQKNADACCTPDVIVLSTYINEICNMQNNGDIQGVLQCIYDQIEMANQLGAYGVVICSNTVYAQVGAGLVGCSLPVISSAITIQKILKQKKLKKPLLLGSRDVMTSKLFHNAIKANKRTKVIIPTEDELDEVHTLLCNNLKQGVFRHTDKSRLDTLVKTIYTSQGIDCVIHTSSVISLLCSPANYLPPVRLDLTQLHALDIKEFICSN
jgi:aspartate racemase